MTAAQFGALVFPDAPTAELAERIATVETLGFDRVVFPDHISDPRNPHGTWHDSWALLAAAAGTTSRVRLGILVANPVLQAPAVLAKRAVTIDHLSAGRLDLGIGAGIFASDHHAVGSQPWRASERMQRFAEYVAIVDGALRSTDGQFNYRGRWFSTAVVTATPTPIQQPRPPLVIGGQSPTILRVAAQHADTWNTHGPPGVTFDQLLSLTTQQNLILDDLCRQAGRDPRTLVRALTMFGAVDPWRTARTPQEVVHRFAAIGITEFVVHWPPPDRRTEFEGIVKHLR